MKEIMRVVNRTGEVGMVTISEGQTYQREETGQPYGSYGVETSAVHFVY